MMQKTSHLSADVCKAVFNSVVDFPLHKMFVTGILCTYTHILHEGKAFVAVFALVILDAAVGVMKAVKKKEFKWSEGFKRSLQKFFVYVIMLLAAGVLDTNFPGEYATTTMKTFLLVTESISIMENISALGWPVPLQLLKFLKMHRGNIEKKDDGQK